MSKIVDLTGCRFNRLQVICRDGSYILNGKVKEPKWKCVCDCGNCVTVVGGSLRSGKTQSCGCLQHERHKQSSLKHGGCSDNSPVRLYRIWSNMKQRCTNPNHHFYKNYGGRGITVNREWQDSYIAFRDWALSNGYSDDLTLDRIDLNGDYNSDNCRWVTYKIQANNKSTNRLITVGDRTKTLSEWSDESGVPVGTLWSRINMYGWTAEKAIFTKVRGKRNE